MARSGIWTGAELQRLLAERTGVRISSSGISRLLQDEQTEIKLIVLDALCVVLKCKPSDLLVEIGRKSYGRHCKTANEK